MFLILKGSVLITFHMYQRFSEFTFFQFVGNNSLRIKFTARVKIVENLKKPSQCVNVCPPLSSSHHLISRYKNIFNLLAFRTSTAKKQLHSFGSSLSSILPFIHSHHQIENSYLTVFVIRDK